ncbi:rhodanese-like domain-containing protein [Rhodanobacter sp. AS-Z3]|uniref:sulfurtransferase n=1 Tax=Rhodanobacter sp. AS-Z3 TaxID=3031330 RepID=UPI002478D346|nr:rhodanese-like domain-containing protein [Rhodanobacter sp. AS-Z3]WEN13954.1 rhodanese-like domain-containing protein [Rhodanobacter sp. AS-Z3]
MQIKIPGKAAVAFAILFGATTLPHRTHAEAAPQATAQSAPWVSTAWLESHLHDSNLVLLQVGEESQYKSAHIPGAHLVRLADVAATSGELSLEMPTAPELRQRLQGLGISDGSRVVVYFGNNQVSVATRIVFTLQSAGLAAHADLLDGGMPKWRREGRTLTDLVTAVTQPGTLTPFNLQPTIVDAAFVRAHARQPGYVLIDARAAMYYDGLEESGADGHHHRGHIPGAHNVPFTGITNDDLTLKTPAELLGLFRKAGVEPGDRVIAYCHIGQQATAVLFAARAVGIDAVLYDGSFEDWTMRDLPVEL